MGLQGRQHPGPVVGTQPGLHAERPLGVGPVTQVAALPDSLVALHRGHALGPHRPAPFLQRRKRLRRCRRHQLRLLLRTITDGGGDLAHLGQGQLPRPQRLLGGRQRLQPPGRLQRHHRRRTDDPDWLATKWAAERLPDPCHARVASTRPAASALPAAARRSISPNRRNASTAAGPSRRSGIETRHHLAQRRHDPYQSTALPPFRHVPMLSNTRSYVKPMANFLVARSEWPDRHGQPARPPHNSHHRPSPRPPADPPAAPPPTPTTADDPHHRRPPPPPTPTTADPHHRRPPPPPDPPHHRRPPPPPPPTPTTADPHHRRPPPPPTPTTADPHHRLPPPPPTPTAADPHRRRPPPPPTPTAADPHRRRPPPPPTPTAADGGRSITTIRTVCPEGIQHILPTAQPSTKGP